MSMKKNVTMCDPPSGWKYGFPKELPSYSFDSRKELEEWLEDEGYPIEEILRWKDGVPCRYFSMEIEE